MKTTLFFHFLFPEITINGEYGCSFLSLFKDCSEDTPSPQAERGQQVRIPSAISMPPSETFGLLRVIIRLTFFCPLRPPHTIPLSASPPVYLYHSSSLSLPLQSSPPCSPCPIFPSSLSRHLFPSQPLNFSRSLSPHFSFSLSPSLLMYLSTYKHVCTRSICFWICPSVTLSISISLELNITPPPPPPPPRLYPHLLPFLFDGWLGMLAGHVKVIT